MTEPVLLTIADNVAHLRFNRPERMNVLSLDMAEAFASAVHSVVADPAIRVLVMTGAGRNFMAGGDLQGFRTTADRPEFIRATIDPIHDTLKALSESDVITIIAAHGHVAGAGVSLVAMADLALAAEGASFTLAYCRIAGVPDCGGSWALPRSIGLKAALAMALCNDPVGAEEALRLGLLNRVVPADDLFEEAMSLARRIARGPGPAQGATKRLMRGSLSADLPQHLDRERAAFIACAGLPDFAEGVAAFLERRAPDFD